MSTKFMTNYPKTEPSAGFLEVIGDGYVSHQPLSEVMPTRIGGVARHYVVATRVEQIVEAAKFAIEHKIPYRVIGAGTATLVGESGFPGLIIRNQTSNIFCLDSSSLVQCDAGVDNIRLVNSLASRGLGGIEFMSVIPGTVGSAIVTNACALGRRLSSYLRQATLFDPDSKKVVTLKQDEIVRPEFLRAFKSDLVFPPIVLALTLQLTVLTQEEIIRRLGLVKSHLPKTTERVLSHLFDEKISNISSDKTVLARMKHFRVSYDQQSGCLTMKKDATPRGVREIVELINQKAKELGLEQEERLTYLGYFTDEDVA